MIERDRSPLTRLQVVQPIKPEPPLFTARQYDDLVHWSVVGKISVALVTVGCAAYVVYALVGVPW